MTFSLFKRIRLNSSTLASGNWMYCSCSRLNSIGRVCFGIICKPSSINVLNVSMSNETLGLLETKLKIFSASGGWPIESNLIYKILSLILDLDSYKFNQNPYRKLNPKWASMTLDPSFKVTSSARYFFFKKKNWKKIS